MNTVLLFCMLVQAEVNLPPQAAPEGAAIDFFKKEASEYSIQLNDARHTKLDLDPKPVLHWNNPARTAEDGAVFVWLKDGRPEVIGTIFTYKIKEVRRKHEFHSLSTNPLTAEFHGKVAWKPKDAGVKFQIIPSAPVPAENARLRLVQMKALAREYTASMKSLEGETSELRLMPQPLYRYEPQGGEVLDGGLFSFALGTDPEALLLIEARREKDVWRWHAAFARFNYAQLSASLKGEVIWKVDADESQTMNNLGDQAHIGKIYSSYHVE